MRKTFILFLLFIIYLVPVFGQMQMPSDIIRILDKAYSGKELTELENARLKEWGNSVEKQYEKLENQTVEPQQSGASIQNINKQCPEKIELTTRTLTRDLYVELAQSLMETYGEKTGDLQKLKSLLESSDKQTDGADMGAAFVMTGAGSASVYSIAWSAVRSPDDILTANNLGVALKDMGEYSKAVQVLQYANQLKPEVGLILCNLGWAYREAGDNVNATLMFEKALKAAPKMSSPYLGLGLIAQCEKNHIKAEQYLRKALTQKFSSVGFAAMKQAQEAKSPEEQSGSQPRPLVDEKGDTQGLNIPDLPVSEDVRRMVGQQESISSHISNLNGRKQKLMSDLFAVIERVKQQQTHAAKDPDNSIVFNRDFSKEIMQINDIEELLFGENSNLGRSQQQGAKLLQSNAKILEQRVPIIEDLMYQDGARLKEKYERIMDELLACGANEACQIKVRAKLKKLQYEGDQFSFRMCKENKMILESSFSAYCKNYTLQSDALKEAIKDYYAFTNPIIKRIYAPSLNEYYNIHRELKTVLLLEVPANFAISISATADEINQLDCIEPELPQPSEVVAEPELPQKAKKECPLGEKGIGGGIGALSFELSCDHVKLSGGEGLLWSVKRDFNKHETTIWGGVGAKGTYGRGNITAEASVGVVVTFGQGDAIKDVAFTSTVKAGVGGLVEAEISGRFALEGGPSISADANLAQPNITDLMAF